MLTEFIAAVCVSAAVLAIVFLALFFTEKPYHHIDINEVQHVARSIDQLASQTEKSDESVPLDAATAETVSVISEPELVQEDRLLRERASAIRRRKKGRRSFRWPKKREAQSMPKKKRTWFWRPPKPQVSVQESS